MNGLLRCLAFLIVVFAPLAVSAQADATPPASADRPADAAAPDGPANPGLGGFSGSRLGGGGLHLPASAMPSPRYVQGLDVIISWSEKGDNAWGFSKATGRWTKQELKPAVADLGKKMAVGSEVAVIQSGNKYYGYGSGAGRWDTLQLPDGHTPPPAITSQNLVLIVDGETIYTFTSRNGRWTSSADETPPPTEPGASDPFSFRGTGLSDDRDLEPMAQLRSRYQTFDAEAAAMAQQLRAFQQVHGPQHPDQKLEVGLRRAVTGAFEARQQLQQTELAALSQRLQAIQQSIAAREKSKEEIINRRVMDLLNPDLQWDATSSAAPETAKGQRNFNPLRMLAGSLAPSTVRKEPTTKIALNQGQPGDVQVLFREPQRAVLDGDISLTIPGRINLKPGKTYNASLRQLFNQPLSLSLEIAPVNPETEEYLQHNAIPAQIVNEDLVRAVGGEQVTKVVYLPNATFQELASANAETLVSTRIDPGLDLVQEASRRGHILAILHVNAPGRPSETDPLAANRRRNPASTSDYGPPGSDLRPTAIDPQSALRAATEMRNRLQEANLFIDELEDILPQLRPQAAKTTQQKLHAAKQQLEALRAEHEARLKLLRLDLDDAESALEAAVAKRKFVERLHEKGYKTSEELQQESAAVEQVQRRIERSKVLLELYQRADDAPAKP